MFRSSIVEDFVATVLALIVVITLTAPLWR